MGASQIAIIVPVLNRPHRALPLAKSAAHGTDIPYRLLFVCSPEDGTQIDACQEAGDTLVVDRECGPGDYAYKTNAGYRATREPWVFTAADDLIFHPRWASAALEIAEANDAHVVGTDDMWNPKVRQGLHSTHTLVRRSYIDDPGASWDGPGILFHEGYSHQWVDTELVAVARARDVWAFSRQSRVEHLHPFAQKSVMDATYEKGLAKGREDGRLFHERRRLYLSG